MFACQRQLSEEQALETAEYFELAPIETKYFRLLVRHASVSTTKLRQTIHAELEELRAAAQSIATRVRTEKTLGEKESAEFYSNWLYTACRLYCSTSASGRSADEIAARFGIPRPRALEILGFLVSTGRCVTEKDLYRMGPQSTFVAKGSPFLGRHHTNWRLQGLRAFEELSDAELMFTGVMSVSRADFTRLRERVAEFLNEFSKTVKVSPAEEIACLNMDFFWIRK